VKNSDIDERFDLARLIVKPLYFGMAVNVMAPAAVLLVCFYLNQNSYMPNRVGDLAGPLLYIFGALAVVESAFALWWRVQLMKKPMLRRVETAEADIIQELYRRSRPVFILIASTSLYGIAYYSLTGRFEEAVFFVIFSFIVFQVVRPRYGFLRQLIRRQLDMVERGEVRTE
jgi:hypothetical protein